MSDLVRTYRVTITKEIRIELPARFSDPELIREWSEALWPIEDAEDIAQHAAEMAAKGFGGYELDGLGLLGPAYSKYPRVPDVKFTELSHEIEVEDA